ncbi:MAG: Sec-independent protein translocase protein TatB, partial [Allosphingosinicella sp.]
MFGIDSGEVLIIAIVALVVIGPKDLPRVMRTIGNFVGRARGMARHFRSGLDAMMRESELEEMDKKWKADNERIMRDYPSAGVTATFSAPTLPGGVTATGTVVMDGTTNKVTGATSTNIGSGY